MTLEFAKNVMSVPACSHHEKFIVKCIKNWCDIAGIKTSQDGAGNLYLTKGGGEWMPCLASHLDTVQHKQAGLADREELMDVKVDGDKLYVDGMGIGADCRAGIAICLAAIEKIPNCKAVFFSGEEIGCQGAQRLDKKFFDNVAYCIEWDSPTWNRAAKSSMGARLFTQEFFDEYVKGVAAKHGVTNFNDEPGTDVHFIVKLTGTTCMNFSNGGYEPHSDREYCLFSEMNKGEELCLDLVKTIPCDRKWEMKFELPPPPKWAAPEGRWSWRGTRTSRHRQPEFDFRGPESRCQVTASFSDMGRFDKFKKELDRRDLAVEIDADGAPDLVVITGQMRHVKAAYVAAFNCEEFTEYKNWDEFARNENPQFFFDLVTYLKPPSGKSGSAPRKSVADASSENADAAFSWVFRTPQNVDRFLEGIAREKIAVEPDPDGFNRVDFSGKMKWVKLAYVMAFDIDNGTDYKSWSEFVAHESDLDFLAGVETGGADDAEIDSYIDVDSSPVTGDTRTDTGFDSQAEAKEFWDWFEGLK